TLAHQLPTSTVKGFDPKNIETGRLYFWIKKNNDEILNSEIIFFILQDRYGLSYMLSDAVTLTSFNDVYNIEEINQYDPDPRGYQILYDDDLWWMQKKIRKEGYTEISQEAIIELLTKRKASELLQQKPLFSIYFPLRIFDVYDGMIQVWSGYHEDSRYSTAFFSNQDDEEAYLEKLIQYEIVENETKPEHKEALRAAIEWALKTHHNNATYKQRLSEREVLLKKFPKVQRLMPLDTLHDFKMATDLKVIDGDYTVDEDLQLCQQEENSMFIAGDLKVKGGIFFTQECRKKIFIVAGNVEAEHFVFLSRLHSYYPIFANDIKISGVTYGVESRYWSLYIGGALHTQTLLHVNKLVIDPCIFYEQKYLTKNLVDALIDPKRHVNKERLCKYLKANKSILKETATEETNAQDRIDMFSFYLSQWGSLFYRFAGFEQIHYSDVDFERCYVEGGDEVLIDMRTQSGRYCMNHEDLELTAIDKIVPQDDKKPSSTRLAKRFYWIMWTFSSWKHRDDGPLDYWQTPVRIDQAFENEKPYCQNDPYLSLYWILHFGLLNDTRYESIKNTMKDSRHGLVQGAIAFIDAYHEQGVFPNYLREHVDINLVKTRIINDIAAIKVAM
ncbi:MAG: hypothetical protein P8163_16440, partial [Candidatus Thiodiazotropha sp.]